VLDHIHCFDEGDGWGSAEPYLWTVFFKVDGDTVALGDDLFLHGNATVLTTPGSHGNLGDADVDEGDDVSIPSAIGELTATLRPIPVPRWITETAGIEDVGGVVGAVAVLMEEDWVSDAGAEAGHAALDAFVRQALEGLVPTLGVGHPDVSEHDLDALTAGAQEDIARAIRSAQSGWDGFVSWLDADDRIGHEVFTFGHHELVPATSTSFSRRWCSEGDWELHGHVTAAPVCPAEAAVAILQALGLLSLDAESGALESVREFRQQHFAGNRELGAWWQLAKRNTAGVTEVLQADPEAARSLVVPIITGLALAVNHPTAPIAPAVLDALDALLSLMVQRGNRRLRIDAKAALSVLPRLRGKTMATAAAVLGREPPTRKPGRLGTVSRVVVDRPPLA